VYKIEDVLDKDLKTADLPLALIVDYSELIDSLV
jgi:hypothetical protein